MSDLRLLGRAILDDWAAPPVAVLAAAWLMILDEEGPLRSLVNEAAGAAPTTPASAESMPPTGRTEVSDMREPTP